MTVKLRINNFINSKKKRREYKERSGMFQTALIEPLISKR